MSYSYKPPAYYASRQPTGRGSSYADVYSNRTVQQQEQNRIEAEAEAKRAAERETIRNVRIAKEQAEERKRLAEEERKRKEAEKKAYDAKILSEAKKIAPDYRESYDAGNPRTFTEAKQAADETYKQYWYDKANNISKNWTQKDYDLILNPQYENVRVAVDSKRGKYRTEKKRKLPENYGKYKEYQERIKEGVLDFSTEETHKRLINPPSRRGYGKRQYWVRESNQLRQAVEAQADVMKDFLDDAGIPIVQKYEDLEGFKRHDSFWGEGLYLNTGTAAHIDWNSGLKRMQWYQSSPDAELGTYSQVFVRPEPDGFAPIGKALSFVGTITGNPVLSAVGTGLQGGDLEDIAKGYIAGQVTAPIVEGTFASLGVDADLLGVDPDAFSDSMMDVQTTMLEGGSGSDALLKELGSDAIKQLGNSLDIDIDLPESEFLSTIEDVLKPVVDVVREGGRILDDTLLQPTKEIVQGITEPVVDIIDEGLDYFGETVVDPTLQMGSDVLSEVEDVAKAGGRAVDDTLLQPVKEGVEYVVDVAQELRDSLPEFETPEFGSLDIELPEMPDIDLPDIDLPNIELPNIELPFNIEGMLAESQQTQTATEQLFDKELFKFDTEIKSTQKLLSPMMNFRRYG